MTLYGCRNHSQAFIVNNTNGEAYFFTYHNNTLKPYTQVTSTAQHTYKSLLANGWKPLLFQEIEEITTIKSNTNNNIYINTLCHIVVGAVWCIMFHKMNSRRRRIK